MPESENNTSHPQKSRFALKSPNDALQPVRVSKPPVHQRQKSGFLAKISGFFTFAVVLGLMFGGAAFYINNQINAHGPLSADKIIVIPKNSSGDDIVEQLANEKIIEHPGLVSAYVMFKRPKFRAGEYEFKASNSILDVMDTLVNGKPITHKVTIPEGLTSEQIVERLIENDVLSGDIADTPKEGSLLPDTYTFERGFTREQMLKSMRLSQERLLKDVWARRSPDVPVRSLNDLVTLASIVEKETGKFEERPHVAGVFVNRMNKDMRLQTDPTVIYGIAGSKGSLGRGLTRTELDTPTPYNTYLIKGLPPGPIANPGRAALEAAANPMKTRDLFFVADGKGGHTFAETNEQHSRNVVRWRQIEQSQKDVPNSGIPQLSAPPNTVITPNLPEQQLLTPQLPSRSDIVTPKTQQQASTSLPVRRSVFDNVPLPKIEQQTVSQPLKIEHADGSSLPTENSLNSSDSGFINYDGNTTSVESYPVPASRRTGGRLSTQPYDPSYSSAEDTRKPDNALSYQSEPNGAAVRSRAFDAVAGTSRDPLRNSTYDLNHAKTIPSLK